MLTRTGLFGAAGAPGKKADEEAAQSFEVNQEMNTLKKLPDGVVPMTDEDGGNANGENYGEQPQSLAAAPENFVIQVANYGNDGEAVTEEISYSARTD